MNTFWFLLTLILDIIPFVILSTFLLKEYLPCSFPAGLAKIVIPLVAYDVLICVTYINVLYNAKVMVLLRVIGLLLTWILMCLTYKNFYLPFAYKCLFTLPYMLGILQISAFCLNFVDTDNLPDFMAITCLRIFFYIIFGYPYYMLEKKFLFSNFEAENRQVWITCIISQFVLNIAMMLTLRTDYAENGVEPKAFFLQIIMTTASMTITVIMYYGFKMSREIEISKEKQMRDELLLELNSKQYGEILLGIEQTKRVRHDIKHHIRAIERLIEEQRIPEIKEYLKEYKLSIPEGIEIKFCENLSINALLVYYYTLAEQNNIEINFDLVALADINIDDIDMNILLGNAIENAMEASMRVDERKRNIIARAKKVAGQIFITIDNQFDGIVRSKEGTMLSGKRDYKKNGYGNISMDAVVTKYQGQIKREINGNRYLVSIVLRDKNS